MPHLKHAASGHLYRGPTGHLSVGCPSHGVGGCACQDLVDPCSLCPGSTPTRFHVTFTGVTLCTDCVNCGTSGPSAKVGPPGSAINGTYVITKNGPCGWTTDAANVPCSILYYGGADCSGAHVTAEVTIVQNRVDAHTFRIQITDAGDNFLLFTADVTLEDCCAGYTANNQTAGCACAGTPATVTLATGGTVTATAC